MSNTNNIEEKINAFKKFWDKEEVERPLIGFDVGGYHPFKRFAALKNIQDNQYLTPDLINPDEFLDDYQEFYERSLRVGDDLLRGVAPIPAVPWMEAILGCPVEISGDSIWAKEREADWEQLENLRAGRDNSWLQCYLEFVEKLVDNARGKYPVGLPILRGITDLLGVLRGHSQSVIDLMENPDLSQALISEIARVIIKVVKEHNKVVDPFQGGYFIEQFSLWAPDRVIRMQNDATAVYSPKLYDNFIKEYDSLIAGAFPYALIHLHPSSLFMLDNFLDIKEIDCFEINKDPDTLTMEEMLPYLQKIQKEDRALYIRGVVKESDFQIIKENLSAKGLCIQIVTDSVSEARELYSSFKKIYS